MKINKNKLASIIKEELSRLLLESEEINKFARLREYLVKPSEEHWKALLDLFEEWEGQEDFEVAVD